MQSLSSPSRIVFVLAVPLCIALLSACPPEWDGLERPPEPGAEPDVEPDDDAGVTPAPDGGVIDAGEPTDGGDADAGAPRDAGVPIDAGVDGGTPLDGGVLTDGGFDGGLPADAGPACEILSVPGTEWTCLTNGAAAFTDCPASNHGPVVDLVIQCPDTFALRANGVIESLNGATLATVSDACSTLGSAPVDGFSNFDVRGTRAVLWNVGAPQMCFADLVGDTCSCSSTGNGILDAELATDERIVASFDDGTLREAGFAPPLNGSETLVTGTGQNLSLASVKRSDDTYLVGAYAEDRQALCFDRTDAGANTSTACAGASTGDRNWSTFTDAEEQQAGRRRVHGFDAATVTAFEQVTDAAATNAQPLRQRSPRLEPFYEAIAFAGHGPLNTESSRIAISHIAGGLQVASGETGSFVVPPLLPANAAEFGAIRDLTFGRDANNTPNSTLWAVADTGIWVSETTATSISAPAFVFDFVFASTPATVEVVLLDGAEVLVVGEAEGRIHLFDIVAGSPNPSLTFRTTFTQLTTSSADSFIPEAIVGVSNAGWSHLVVLTTGDEVWGASFQDGNAISTAGLTLQAQDRFKTQLDVPTVGGRFVISKRIIVDPTIRVEQVFVTAKKDTNEFGSHRYSISASSPGGPGLFSILQLGVRNSIDAPLGTEPAFRFFFDSAIGAATDEGTALWTTNDGSVTALQFNGNNLDPASQAMTSPSDALVGGAYAFRQTADCGIAFAIDRPEYFTFAMDTPGAFQRPTTPVPGAIQINAVLPISSTLAVAGGNGGHLFQVTLTDATGCVSAVTELASLQARITSDITQLQWRRADELLVADEDGRVWIVHLP